MSVSEFATVVFVLGRIYGLSVTSWGRTAARNEAVGGVRTSKHLSWLAVDVVPDDRSVLEELSAAAARLGLMLIDEHDHLHIQVGGAR